MADREPGHGRRGRRRVAVLLLVAAAGAPALAFAEPPFPAHPPSAGEPPAIGARADELLELGRRLNPGIAARALEAEAAMARADAAGRFPDPMFTTEFEDIQATGGTYAPESLGRVKYTVAQTIPLWGKRGLERRMASAEADAAEAQCRAAEVELDQRIKVVFANYYAAEATIGVTRELLRTVTAIAEAAQSRYAQGRGNQQDAISAEAEKGRPQLDLARQEAERRGAAGRLNALLDRPMDAPLVDPETLRPVPIADAMPLGELLERARRSNPSIDAEGAEITAAKRGIELVRRNWYPDVTLGLSVYDEDGAGAGSSVVTRR